MKTLLVLLVAQSWPILCDPKDCNWPVSSVHGILQSRILEWFKMLLNEVSLAPAHRRVTLRWTDEHIASKKSVDPNFWSQRAQGFIQSNQTKITPCIDNRKYKGPDHWKRFWVIGVRLGSICVRALRIQSPFKINSFFDLLAHSFQSASWAPMRGQVLIQALELQSEHRVRWGI